MIHDIALTDADKDWLPEDYWQSIPEYMRVGIQKHFAQRRFAMQAASDHRWLPISQFDGWPTGAGNPVFVAVTAEGHQAVVGEAYWDPDAYDGTWWWAGTRKDDYHESPIEEMQHGKVTHFCELPTAPSSEAEAKHHCPACPTGPRDIGAVLHNLVGQLERGNSILDERSRRKLIDARGALNRWQPVVDAHFAARSEMRA